MFSLHDPIDEEIREELKAHDDYTAALLARRGVTTSEEAEAFLSPSYDAHIGDPLLILRKLLMSKNELQCGVIMTVTVYQEASYFTIF
jgi:hypothetical protein